ncbi:hypothetical protein K8R42_00915 [bacterium]|nr:hypothetical protein [bacterium]
MRRYIKKILNQERKGAIALMLVIMVTALTIISSVVISLVNISDILASYHRGAAREVNADIDACLDDALVRIASSTDFTGHFFLDAGNVTCSSTVSSIVDGLKIVTSTASSTSDAYHWFSAVVVKVDVSTTPISINSYKKDPLAYDSYTSCGDGICNGVENASTCAADCQVCGNGVVEGTEVCDDHNVITESCGDGVVHSGSDYCNADCSATYAGGEGCDYRSLSPCGTPGSPSTASVGCTKNPYCWLDCSSCTNSCF